MEIQTVIQDALYKKEATLIFILLTILLFSCDETASPTKTPTPEDVDTVWLSNDNIYEYLSNFEYSTYNDSGVIQDYGYTSPINEDTLLHINYDQYGNPKSVKDGKNSFIVANCSFKTGKIIVYTISPPGFYNRIRVKNDLDEEESIIDTISNVVNFNILEHQQLEVLVTAYDSITNRHIYDASGFKCNDSYLIMDGDSIFTFD
jgi:hypothetical protein